MIDDVTLLAAGTYTETNQNRNYWSSYIEGKTTGTYAWKSTWLAQKNSGQVRVWRNGQQLSYIQYISGVSASGSTVVTKYGNVGERVEGTFSGTLYNVDTDAPVTVTNGRFSVTRRADFP